MEAQPLISECGCCTLSLSQLLPCNICGKMSLLITYQSRFIKPDVWIVCFRCGWVPGVCSLTMPASVPQYSGLLPLYLPPWISAVRTSLHWSVSSIFMLHMFIIRDYTNVNPHLYFKGYVLSKLEYYPWQHNLIVGCTFPDINECMRNICPAHQQCRNTEGGYQCFDSCPAGMTKADNGACKGKWLSYIHLVFIQAARCTFPPNIYHLYIHQRHQHHTLELIEFVLT